MQLREIMSTPVVTCRTEDNLNAAAKLMWDHDIGSLPVVDNDGRTAGMITDRDICMAAYTRGGPLADISVWDAMAKQVFSCHPDDSLEAAERLMSDKQIRRVPVVDADDRPMAMLSLNDVARHTAAARKRNGLDRELTQTLAAICQPRPREQRQSPMQARAQAQPQMR
jgi:CBS domain-containing protein